MNVVQDTLLKLVGYGIGNLDEISIPEGVDWQALMELSQKQGVAAIALDGIGRFEQQKPVPGLELPVKKKWIGKVYAMETRYSKHEKATEALAQFYRKHGIRMMVIKGWGLSLNYPKPHHRPSGDIDIYLFGDLEKGDQLVHDELGIEIDNTHHNHSVFRFQGATIENHYNFVHIETHHSSKKVEAWLKEDAPHAYEQNGVWLPSANFNALYVLRHAACHFAAEKIGLRHLLDWAFFVEKHYEEVDWQWLWKMCCELNQEKFLLAINDICVRLLGFDAAKFRMGGDAALTERVLMEILQPAYDKESPRGVLPYIQARFNRWWTNRWKHKIVYSESLTLTFLQQVWAHLLKPSSLHKE